MNMKWKLNSGLLLAVLSIMVVLAACNDRSAEQHYTPESVNILVQTASPNKQVLSRQATVKLQSGSTNAAMEAQGYIIPDPNRDHVVAARFSGRIEKLYVKFSGQMVKKGAKIMDLYSPDLLTFQEEHLFLIRSGDDNPLVEKSRTKLLLLGMLENQIRQLEKKGTVALLISVFSPENGYVFFDMQTNSEDVNAEKIPENKGMTMQGTGGNQGTFATAPSQIREGVYINEGQALFKVNDLKEVWALVSVSEQNAGQVRVNQFVQIVAEDDLAKKHRGKIILIEPAFTEANQHFVRVRITLTNPDNTLKLNTLIAAQLGVAGNSQLQVPSSAVYKTGLNAYVWVKTDTTEKGTGVFQLRRVVAGSTQNGNTSIVSGLRLDEEIAKEAGLMSDSESFLNTK